MEQKTKNIKLIALFSVIVLAMLSIGLGIGGVVEDTSQTKTSDGITEYSLVRVYKNSELVGQNHNLITNIGKDMIKLATGNPTSIVTNATVQVLGNTSAPAVGDTTLSGIISNCGLTGKPGSYSSNGASNGNWTLSSTWTSTCNNLVVNTTGLYNMTTSGNLFAGTSFTSTTLQSGDVITVNYTVWVA